MIARLPATETRRDGGGDAAEAPGPYLVLALECARPAAGAARYSLVGIDEVRIGRGERRAARRTGSVLAIEIPDTSMSTEHARLVRAGAAWSLHDAGSKNGTHVNGVRAVRQALVDRDVVEAAQTFFVLRRGPGEADPGDLAVDIEAGDLATLDPRLAAQLATLDRLVRADVPLLVLGETGTGRARTSIASSSSRCSRPIAATSATSPGRSRSQVRRLADRFGLVPEQYRR